MRSALAAQIVLICVPQEHHAVAHAFQVVRLLRLVSTCAHCWQQLAVQAALAVRMPSTLAAHVFQHLPALLHMSDSWPGPCRYLLLLTPQAACCFSARTAGSAAADAVPTPHHMQARLLRLTRRLFLECISGAAQPVRIREVSLVDGTVAYLAHLFYGICVVTNFLGCLARHSMQLMFLAIKLMHSPAASMEWLRSGTASCLRAMQPACCCSACPTSLS